VWGSSYEVGNDVIASTYYRKWGITKNFYVLSEASQIVFIYFHFVRAIKFPMLPKHHCVRGNNHVYELLAYAKHVIKSILAILDVDD
jgi:hypothetical protein